MRMPGRQKETDMKRILSAVIAAVLFFPAFLRAENDFARYLKRYQDLSSEWKDYVTADRRSLVRKSLDPQARRELNFHQELVDDFVKSSREIRNALVKLKLDGDFPLVRHAEDMRGDILLYEREIQNGLSKAKKAPDTAFRVMEADLEGLKEIGFSCEKGVGTLSAEAAAWPEFYRYRRQIRMLKLYLDVREKTAQMDMSLQRNKRIVREFSSITASAEQLSSRILQDLPDLKQDGLLLPILTRNLMEEAKLQTSPASGLKGMASSAQKSRAPNQWLPRIERILLKIESRIRESFRKEEKDGKPVPEKKKPEPVRNSPDPVRPVKAEKAPEKKREVPLERLSEEELNSELSGLRRKILPGANKKVLTADELDRCLDLLSERERKQYETIRLRQIRNGSDPYGAPLEALKEMKELLMAPDAVFPTRQEKIRILKKAKTPDAKE